MKPCRASNGCRPMGWEVLLLPASLGPIPVATTGSWWLPTILLPIVGCWSAKLKRRCWWVMKGLSLAVINTRVWCIPRATLFWKVLNESPCRGWFMQRGTSKWPKPQVWSMAKIQQYWNIKTWEQRQFNSRSNPFWYSAITTAFFGKTLISIFLSNR